jgi:tetratricopeptide (TPR) repeat protein
MTESEFFSNGYDDYYQRGNEQIAAGDYEEAILSFEQALQFKAHDHDALCQMGNAHFYLQQYDLAKACCEQALVSKPDSQVAWENRGLAMVQLQRYETAIASFDYALEIQPDRVNAWWGKGNALQALGRTKAAIAAYDRSIELQPDSATLWALRGDAYEKLKHYSEALASYQKVLELTQDQGDRRAEAEMLIKMSYLYILNGRSQEALSAIDRSRSIIKELDLLPDDPLHSWGQMESDVSFEQMPHYSLMNLWGRLISFGTKGKCQGFLVHSVSLLMIIPVFFLVVPRMILYWISQRLTRRNA